MSSDSVDEQPAPQRRILARALIILAGFFSGVSAFASAAAAYPVVGAAGDVACNPRSSYFNGGYGTSTRCHMRQTARVLSSMSPDRVLPLGGERACSRGVP